MYRPSPRSGEAGSALSSGGSSRSGDGPALLSVIVLLRQRIRIVLIRFIRLSRCLGAVGNRWQLLALDRFFVLLFLRRLFASDAANEVIEVRVIVVKQSSFVEFLKHLKLDFPGLSAPFSLFLGLPFSFGVREFKLSDLVLAFPAQFLGLIFAFQVRQLFVFFDLAQLDSAAPLKILKLDFLIEVCLLIGLARFANLVVAFPFEFLELDLLAEVGQLFSLVEFADFVRTPPSDLSVHAFPVEEVQSLAQFALAVLGFNCTLLLLLCYREQLLHITGRGEVPVNLGV